MSRRPSTVHRRRLDGRRKPAPRIGWWPALLFAVLCAVAAVAGMTLEERLRRPAPAPKPVNRVTQAQPIDIAGL
jgi:hypothetical protein